MKETPELTCICCGSDSFRRFRTLKGYTLFRCRVCSFVTVHPLPDLQTLEAHYNATRTGEAKLQQRRQLVAGFLAKSNNPKRDFFSSVLSQVSAMLGKPALDILEVGSGLGVFVQHANSTGHHATGTEVTKEYADMSSESLDGRIIHVEGDRYTDRFTRASFDLVYMEHVFEHVLHPDAILSQVKQLLRPGGILLLAVPNMDSLSSRLQGKYWSWAVPPDHLYFYNRLNLSLLLEKHGLAVTESVAMDYYHRSIPQMFSLRRALNVCRTLCGLERKPYKYAYPETLGDHLILAPYYLLYPLIRRSWKRWGGSELVVFARCPT
jgi:2-polyprenyl-3-methyl-5-hydroxy-6-metoxy-1,4-benzoquinol methylase